MLVSTFPALWWMNKNGKDECGGHQARDEIEGLVVVPVDLPQIGEKQRSKNGGECPWQHHQTENRADVARSEIVSREGRSDAIRAAVAHHEDECDNCQRQE